MRTTKTNWTAIALSIGAAISPTLAHSVDVPDARHAVSSQRVSTLETEYTAPTNATPRTSAYVEKQAWPQLSEQDWAKYDKIMKGPRGYFSPGMDPVMALGMEETDPKARKKYIEMAAKQEHDRVGRELAYAREYKDAFLRLYGDEPLFDQQRLAKMIYDDHQNDIDKKLRTGDRYAYFVVLDNCVGCEQLAAQFLTRIKERKLNIAVDFYFVGKKSTPDAIQKWALAAHLDKTAVEQGRITLNVENGQLTQIGGVARAAAVRTSNSVSTDGYILRGDQVIPAVPTNAV